MRPNLLCTALILLSFAGINRADGPKEASAIKPSSNYEKEIAAFEAKDKKSPPAPGGIVFVGDSAIRMWTTLETDFPEQKGVLNRGFGGSQSIDALYYADRIVIPYKPRLIVFKEGGNDLTAGKTPEQILANFQGFVEKVRAALPDVRIAYQGINPNPARWSQKDQRQKANALIKAYVASGKNLDFIEIWDVFLDANGKPRPELFIKDQLHNNAAGYKIMAEAVRPHLSEKSSN
ncbi:MAG TPA: SGNH/GDSL hydrolase family protein [Tepidisphaeraceae bacterium]|nr:SGNH/GDSL hydrolase family protein [Tepidisphaeraceae bacterium]